MIEIIRNNPAIAVGVARAVITALLMLGLTLSTEQETAIVVLVQLALSLVTAKLTVPKVLPVDAPANAVQKVEPL